MCAWSRELALTPDPLGYSAPLLFVMRARQTRARLRAQSHAPARRLESGGVRVTNGYCIQDGYDLLTSELQGIIHACPG